MRPLLAALLFLLVGTAEAQYGSRPVHILVPFAAGGASDVYSRLAAAKITEQTGKGFVVENRTGAGGRLCWEAGAKAAPDGATVVLIDATYPMLPGLFDKLPWDVANDLVPAALIAQTPFVVVAGPNTRLKTLRALIAEAKANPGKLNYGSAGVGSVTHVATALFLHNAGIDVTHVPYKNAPQAVLDIVSGEITFGFVNAPLALPQVRGGKLRALAVTGAKRSPAAPEFPTMAEAGLPNFVVESWYGLMAPAGTPEPVLRKIHDATIKVLATPEVKQAFAKQGADVETSTPAEFARMIATEKERWAEVIRKSGAKVD